MSVRLETPRLSGWLPWSLALVFSLAAHVGVFRLNPNLLMGQPSARAVPRREIPASQINEIRMRELRRELRRLEEEVPPARAPEELPARGGEGEPVFGEVLPSAFRAVLPDPERVMAALPPSENRPELPEPGSDWLPREEVMAITDERLAETLDFLPRVLPPEVSPEERRRVPDIRLPSETPPPSSGELAFHAPLPPLALLPGVGKDVAAPPGLPDLLLPLPGGTGDLPAISPPETSDPLPPALAEEITGMAPVESLLRLETRVYEDPADSEHRYFKIQVLRDGIEALPVLPREVVFLVDASASMTQEKVEAAAEGIRVALNTLRPEDRFNILVFRDRVERLADESPPADSVRRAGARSFLTHLRAYGRTDVYASLEALRSLPREAGRPFLSLLVTDGVPTQGVTDSSEILERFTQANDGEISVFGVGAGRRVNRLLLDFLGFRNRGDARVVDRNAELPGAVLEVAEQIARPVLADLRYRFTGAGELEIYPSRLTHLFLDRPLVLVGRAPRERSRLAFQMIGRSGGTLHDMVFEVDLAAAPRGPSSLRREWAWQAVLEAIAASIADPAPEILDRVRRLADENRLAIPEAYSPE